MSLFIFSNLATSLDGKIATASREYHPLGTERDRAQMQVLRKRCDALLMGASTLRTFKRACAVRGARKKLLNIILSRGLEGVSPEWPFFKSDKIDRLLVVTGRITQARLHKFRKTSTVLILRSVDIKTAGSVARAIASALEAIGKKRLLVEGGGGVMWDFAKDDLIDEYHVTLTPRIVGGSSAPTLVDGVGFEPRSILTLRLAKCKKVGDELFLVYRRKKPQRVR